MIKAKKIKDETEAVLILPDIRSAINVGSIFRTADAVGISKIFLTGYTPRPTDKFGRIQKDIAKSALGAEMWVPWSYEEDTLALIKNLKKLGYKIISVEQNGKSVDYRNVRLEGKIAIVLGSEVEGVSGEILSLSDTIVEIPMHGKKESLNVSVACGVVLFRVMRP